MKKIHAHPYFPESLVLHDYVPNQKDVGPAVTTFVGMWMTILASTWYISALIAPHLNKMDKSVLLWFVLCGTLHVFFEGYFVLNHATFGREQFLFAQLWKEYVLSDSRYISSDSTVLCEEAITVLLWGPMSYLTALFILVDSPYRHPFQIMVSLAHVYGDLLYISTSLFDLYYKGISYSRPEPYYFWFYFLFLNSIWLFVPTALLYQSTTAISEAFQGWNHVRKIYQGKDKRSKSAEPTLEGVSGLQDSRWANNERSNAQIISQTGPKTRRGSSRPSAEPNQQL